MNLSNICTTIFRVYTTGATSGAGTVVPRFMLQYIYRLCFFVFVLNIEGQTATNNILNSVSFFCFYRTDNNFNALNFAVSNLLGIRLLPSIPRCYLLHTKRYTIHHS
jgi:hypothetical protein